ncbi:hypothetical protein DPX39_040022400 [Trypanosoma brucei equiperdum]|uniref:Uncharacterized protein n=1 Tax=Trypanosoma brucei equiperdum TaxID=630700 RepID=A0A3L6LFD2_9TRYP|nr:hypothetical protein DPX39_040022400 [Trypanosoma brucei equiperdum]
MKLWQHLPAGALRKVRKMLSPSGASAAELDEALNQYISAIHPTVFPHLTPRHLLRVIPAQPLPVRTVWRRAISMETVPSDMSFEAFKSALMPLVPLFLSLSSTTLGEDGDEGPLVRWQPWVSDGWRNAQERTREQCGDGVISELSGVVPTYFVSYALLKEQTRLGQLSVATLHTLERKELVGGSVPPVLEWSEDHSVVRLSNEVIASSSSTRTANSFYSLQSQPEVLRRAVNILALLLPTFKASVGEVRAVYKLNFITPGGLRHSAITHEFAIRFPDALALVDHPDVQFVIDRDSEGCVMLHSTFLHTSRGAANVLYMCTSVGHPLSISPHGVDTNEGAGCLDRYYLRVDLPYAPRCGDEVVLQAICSATVTGLYCVQQPDKDRFSLEIATAQGAVIVFDSTISLLCRLSTAGAPCCGFPAEIVTLLASPNIVKLIHAAPTVCTANQGVYGNVLDGLSLLYAHLKTDFQCVCTFHQLALFVGIPTTETERPGQCSLLSNRLITCHGGVALPYVRPALLAAVCASRLIALHLADGHEFDRALLQQLLRDAVEGSNALVMRNLQLRLKRYGMEPHGTCTKHSCEALLQEFLVVYGPEVCFADKFDDFLSRAASSTEIARTVGKNRSEEDDGEYIRELLLDQPTSTVERDEEDMDVEHDVQGELSKCCKQNVGSGDSEVTKHSEGEQDNMEEAYNFLFDCSGAGATDKGSNIPPSHRSSNHMNCSRGNEQSERSTVFVLPLPNLKGHHMTSRNVRWTLPPSFSRTNVRGTITTKAEQSVKTIHGASTRSLLPEQRDPTNWHIDKSDEHTEGIASEGALIERLTQEVLCATSSSKTNKRRLPACSSDRLISE